MAHFSKIEEFLTKESKKLEDYKLKNDPKEEIISSAAWDRAQCLLKNMGGFFEDLPIVGCGPDNSCDLWWKSKNFEVLINIPKEGDISFYGDNITSFGLKGTLTMTCTK